MATMDLPATDTNQTDLDVPDISSEVQESPDGKELTIGDTGEHRYTDTEVEKDVRGLWGGDTERPDEGSVEGTQTGLDEVSGQTTTADEGIGIQGAGDGKDPWSDDRVIATNETPPAPEQDYHQFSMAQCVSAVSKADGYSLRNAGYAFQRLKTNLRDDINAPFAEQITALDNDKFSGATADAFRKHANKVLTTSQEAIDQISEEGYIAGLLDSGDMLVRASEAILGLAKSYVEFQALHESFTALIGPVANAEAAANAALEGANNMLALAREIIADLGQQYVTTGEAMTPIGNASPPPPPPPPEEKPPGEKSEGQTYEGQNKGGQGEEESTALAPSPQHLTENPKVKVESSENGGLGTNSGGTGSENGGLGTNSGGTGTNSGGTGTNSGGSSGSGGNSGQQQPGIDTSRVNEAIGEAGKAGEKALAGLGGESGGTGGTGSGPSGESGGTRGQTGGTGSQTGGTGGGFGGGLGGTGSGPSGNKKNDNGGTSEQSSVDPGAVNDAIDKAGKAGEEALNGLGGSGSGDDGTTGGSESGGNGSTGGSGEEGISTSGGDDSNSASENEQPSLNKEEVANALDKAGEAAEQAGKDALDELGGDKEQTPTNPDGSPIKVPEEKAQSIVDSMAEKAREAGQRALNETIGPEAAGSEQAQKMLDKVVNQAQQAGEKALGQFSSDGGPLTYNEMSDVVDKVGKAFEGASDQVLAGLNDEARNFLNEKMPPSAELSNFLEPPGAGKFPSFDFGGMPGLSGDGVVPMPEGGGMPGPGGDGVTPFPGGNGVTPEIGGGPGGTQTNAALDPTAPGGQPHLGGTPMPGGGSAPQPGMGGGAPMMPPMGGMGAGMGAQQGQNRESSTWLLDTNDSWREDGEHSVQRVIGRDE